LDPIPNEEIVEKYYKEDFYKEENKFFNDSSIEVQLKDKVFFNSRWERIYKICSENLRNLKGKRIYDIGFGFAQALLFFKQKGLICSGIEPAKEGVDYALRNGINAELKGIEDRSSYSVPVKQDIVMMINVLEHLRKPYETLKNIRELLIDDDGILIIEVPNEYNVFQTIANKEYKLKEWWLAPPKHINYFSPISLSNLLKKSGFEIIKKESSFPMEMFLLFGDQYVGNNELGSICHKKRVNFETLMIKHGYQEKLYSLYESFAELELGRQIVIYARPKI
jgi:2-polyprenyl-3-methyl-5-hydroxy-6-metoxy-1,4-benzoquinol methylase